MKGKIVAKFAVSPNGQVMSLDLSEDTLRDPEVAACIRQIISRYQFAPPGQIVTLAFPFVFQAASMVGQAFFPPTYIGRGPLTTG